MKPQTYEEACEIVTMYVYDNATFTNGLHELQVRNDRVAWLKTYRDMLDDDLSAEESITQLLKRELDIDVRDKLLATWVNFVNKHSHLPHREDDTDRTSDNSVESDEPDGSDDDTDRFDKVEPQPSLGERFRNRYRDPGTTNTRKDVA